MITIDEDKTIRFIDSHYNDLFYLRDGENIILTYSNGEKLIRPCTFVDVCHTQVGSNTFHICQFAEIMERNGTTCAPEKPVRLPDKCFSTLPASGELIVIEKNKDGYQLCGTTKDTPDENKRFAKSHNRSMRITAQQEAAMLGGALYGWKTRASRPSNYNFYGVPITPVKAKSAKSKGQER